MYWARMRHGSTPRVTWTPMSRWSGVPTSSGPIAVATPTDGAFVPAARVERAGNLALLVEDVPALLDAARDQHVAVDAEEVLAVEARLLDLLQRADRLGFARDGHGGPNSSGSAELDFERGKGRRLAARGAPQDVGRLGRLLPDLWLRPALLRGVGRRASRRVPSVRRRDAVALPAVRRAFLLRVRRRLRELRSGAQAGGAVRRPDPP